ncbi:CU044_5270 family protein [Streptomyces justiciae]|uniref:CU044_5270 family protein n=1 Tax=Streptomyces justiciae TaxID=2780140 RepID=UPI0018807E52|nr:CU044_5270 family protein [Streptomyces justiciae]MBE8478384.1 CU044_5270 family protein [Streptomyces justiciae]
MKNSQKRPDVLRVLADARPDELDPARLTDLARQRQDLGRIVSEPANTRAARRSPRVRPLGAVALVAVAASVVVSVGTFDRQGPAERSAASPQASVGAQSPSAAPDLRLDGRIQLLSAARKAEASPAAGTYWQTTTLGQYVDVAEVSGRLFAVRSSSTEAWSVGVRPGTKSLMVSDLDSRTEPRTAADKATWQAVGSPRTVRIEVGQPANTHALALKMGAGRPTVMRTDVGGKIYAVGPDNVSYKDLQALPTTSDGLRRHLEGLYARGNGTEGAASDRSAWVLRQAGNLVTMPVKPGVRAAAYRLMADLPGVRVVGHVTDPLGREGVGVEFPGAYRTPLGTTRQRLVIDPSTGDMLSDELLLTEPSARAQGAGLKAGTVVNYQATSRMGWSERQITVPKNAQN